MGRHSEVPVGESALGPGPALLTCSLLYRASSPGLNAANTLASLCPRSSSMPVREGSRWLRGPGWLQEALLLQAGLQREHHMSRWSWRGTEAGKVGCELTGLPSPAWNPGALASPSLSVRNTNTLASDDLELAVLAAAGHLDGRLRDHALGEGPGEGTDSAQPMGPERRHALTPGDQHQRLMRSGIHPTSR